MSTIVKESIPQFYTGQRTVGTSEIALAPQNIPIFKNVYVKAALSNTNWIKVGTRGAASNGWPLLAGEQVGPLYLESTDSIGVIAGAANQSYSYILS